LAAHARIRAMGGKPPPHMPGADAESAAKPLNVELPSDVAVLLRAGLDQEAEALLRDHEASLRARHQPREYESLCAAYGKLAGAGRRYRLGQQAARWSALMKPPDARTRWLWECIYPRPHLSIVERVESEFKLPDHLVFAVMRQESMFQPAIVSPADATGLMQLIEPTARRVSQALDVEYDRALLELPSFNIRFGGYYLRRLLDTFGQRLILAAAAYNAGPSAVSRWLEGGEGLPLDVFVARIPYRETRIYVNRVVGNLARYAYLEGGDSNVPSLKLEIDRGLRAGSDAY
jgi:soluble lytic murein transglycosylase